MLLRMNKTDMYEIDEVGTGTPMNTAVRLGHHQVVEVLLKHCTKTKSHTNFYRAELVLAVTLLHADVVRVLLKHGVNVHTENSPSLLQIALSDESWLRAQYFATSYEVERIVAILVEHGAPTDGLSAIQQQILERILKQKNEVIEPATPPGEPNKEICYFDAIVEVRDMMSVILDKLHLREFSRLMRTSKKILLAIENDKFWQKKLTLIAKNSFNTSVKSFNRKTIWTRLLQHMKILPHNMPGKQPFDEKVVAHNFYNAKRFDIHLTLNGERFEEMLAQCTNLQTLKIHSIPLVLANTSLVSTSLTSLRVTYIEYEEKDKEKELNVFKVLPELRKLRLTLPWESEILTAVLESIHSHCKKLRKLHLYTYNQAESLTNVDLFKKFSDLESLSLEFSPISLDAASRHCPNLTKLTIYGKGDVSSCLNQPDNAVLKLTRLISLSLEQNAEPTDEFIVRLLNGSSTIQKLRVNHTCSNIFSVLSEYIEAKSQPSGIPQNISSKWPLHALSGLKKLDFYSTIQQFYMILDACPMLEDVTIYDNPLPERSLVNFGHIFARARNLKRLKIKGTFDQSYFGDLIIAPKLARLELELGAQMSLMSDAIMVYLAQCCPMLKQLSLASGMVFSQCVTVLWRKYFQHLSELEFSYFDDLAPWIRSERSGGVKTYYYQR